MTPEQQLAEIVAAFERYKSNCADPTKQRGIAAIGFAVMVEMILQDSQPLMQGGQIND